MVRLIGTVVSISDLQTFKGTDYKKKNIIIESLEMKVPWSIDFSNERIEFLSDVKVGQIVQMSFVVRGNYDKKDTSKVYNSFDGRSISELTINE